MKFLKIILIIVGFGLVLVGITVIYNPKEVSFLNINKKEGKTTSQGGIGSTIAGLVSAFV